MKEENDGVFFSSKKKKHKEKKNAEYEGSLPFFFRFDIWDEVFLLSSHFHVPSTLSSPPFLSLVSHVSSKLYVIQAQKLS
jgi:hypothetical protein